MSQCKFCKTSKVAYIWQNKVVKFYLKKNKKHSNLQFKISYKPSTPIKRHQSDDQTLIPVRLSDYLFL